MEDRSKKSKIAIGIIIYLVICIPIFFIYFAWLGSDSSRNYEYKTITATEPKVYVTRTGDLYHSGGCRYLSQSKIAKGRYQAYEEGYFACSVCGGKSSGTITVSYKKKVEVDPTGKNVGGSIALTLLSAIIPAVLIYSWWDERQPAPSTKNGQGSIKGAPTDNQIGNSTPHKFDRTKDPFYIELKSHPQEKLNNMIGVTVVHKKFGEGKVVAISKDYLSVDFPGYETKQFVFPDAFYDKHLEIKKSQGEP